ncbi:hypothetical protein ACFSUS_02865 [Spirosoma soli]|uniref:DUF2079 domain-containing protein n=1 Tax=Spirosoma soli TaxID=1770529 RepID=A0ABW5LXQ8_9BACT
MHRSTYWICLAVLGFFAFKLLRFVTLAYTFNDMYAFLQMSRSWMDGRPFMYENIWGYHHQIHNYYTVLLWGPFCRLFGAYGLFAVQSGLLLISYALVNERLVRSKLPNWARYTLLGVVLLGPVTFWLNDHPNIGWHTELTYLPLALLFALALMGNSQIGTFLAGLGVVLVKEDGAVLAALIHLSFDGIRYVRQHPDKAIWGWVTQRRFWFIALGWFVVFVAGMIWLSYKNNFAEPRLQIALKLIGDNVGKSTFWRQIGMITGQSLVLLLPVAGSLSWVAGKLKTRSTPQLLLLWWVGVGLLTGLNFVQSSHYYGQPLFHLVSLTWPPRFILLWAFSAAFFTLLLGQFADQLQKKTRPTLAWLLIATLVTVQLPLLYLARPDFISLNELISTFRGRYSSEKNSKYLQAADLAIVRCLADRLPAQSNVFAFDYLVPFFHRNYEIWPTGKQYRPADIALLPIDDPQKLRTKMPLRHPYRIIRLNAYNLYVSTPYEHIVEQCVH